MKLQTSPSGQPCSTHDVVDVVDEDVDVELLVVADVVAEVESEVVACPDVEFPPWRESTTELSHELAATLRISTDQHGLLIEPRSPELRCGGTVTVIGPNRKERRAHVGDPAFVVAPPRVPVCPRSEPWDRRAERREPTLCGRRRIVRRSVEGHTRSNRAAPDIRTNDGHRVRVADCGMRWAAAGVARVVPDRDRTTRRADPSPLNTRAELVTERFPHRGRARAETVRPVGAQVRIADWDPRVETDTGA